MTMMALYAPTLTLLITNRICTGQIVLIAVAAIVYEDTQAKALKAARGEESTDDQGGRHAHV